MLILMFLIFSYIKSENSLVIVDHVDLIELNHFYNEKMEHVFDQFIFYDWSSQLKKFIVVDWRLKKDPNKFVCKNHHTNRWELVMHDEGNLRHIISKSHRETWTQYDPELRNRNIVTQENRRGLTQIAVNEPQL